MCPAGKGLTTMSDPRAVPTFYPQRMLLHRGQKARLSLLHLLKPYQWGPLFSLQNSVKWLWLQGHNHILTDSLVSQMMLRRILQLLNNVPVYCLL